jgi:hypothetical protein
MRHPCKKRWDKGLHVITRGIWTLE